MEYLWFFCSDFFCGHLHLAQVGSPLPFHLLQLVQRQMAGDGRQPRAQFFASPVDQSLIGANESLLSHLAGRLLLLCDGKRFCEDGTLVLFHDEGKELGLSVL